MTPELANEIMVSEVARWRGRKRRALVAEWLRDRAKRTWPGVWKFRTDLGPVYRETWHKRSTWVKPAAGALMLAACCSGCSWVSVTHCTFWNVLPSLGFAYDPPVCAGGQPTQYVKPKLP